MDVVPYHDHPARTHNSIREIGNAETALFVFLLPFGGDYLRVAEDDQPVGFLSC
jgi:hypothetical protein